MEAQANTTREQSNKNNIYDVGWQPSHGKNGGGGKKKLFQSENILILSMSLWRAYHDKLDNN